MGYNEHEFACIPVVAIHIITSLVWAQVTCELHLYKQFLQGLVFLSNWYLNKQQNGQQQVVMSTFISLLWRVSVSWVAIDLYAETHTHARVSVNTA